MDIKCLQHCVVPDIVKNQQRSERNKDKDREKNDTRGTLKMNSFIKDDQVCQRRQLPWISAQHEETQPLLGFVQRVWWSVEVVGIQALLQTEAQRLDLNQ